MSYTNGPTTDRQLGPISLCDTRGVRRGMTVIALVAALASACSDDGGDLDAFCATARRFTADNPAAALDRLDPADPSATSAALDAAAEQLRGWADDAPGEVRDDVDTLAAAAAGLASSFSDTTRTSTDEYVVVDAADAEAASARVLAFTTEHCQVDLDPATTSPVATPTTAPPADG